MASRPPNHVRVGVANYLLLCGYKFGSGERLSIRVIWLESRDQRY